MFVGDNKGQIEMEGTCGINFQKLVLQLRKNLGEKNLNKKIDPSGKRNLWVRCSETIVFFTGSSG